MTYIRNEDAACMACADIKRTGNAYGKCHKHADGNWSCGEKHFDRAAIPDAHDDDHAVLVAYLLSAVRRADWHAVSDAANDLRVLEAQRGKR